MAVTAAAAAAAAGDPPSSSLPPPTHGAKRFYDQKAEPDWMNKRLRFVRGTPPPNVAPVPTALVSTFEDESEEILMNAVWARPLVDLIWAYLDGPDENGVRLTREQRLAISSVAGGYTMFLTGKAGTGKSFAATRALQTVLRTIKSVHVTASTGVSADHIGGKTIYSWAGIGLGMGEDGKYPERWAAIGPHAAVNEAAALCKAMNPKSRENWIGAARLLVDETGFLPGYVIDLLCEVGRRLRKDPRPFGGLPVFFIGDPLQLPPVSGDVEVPFFFQAHCWPTLCHHQIQLTVVKRQEGDAAFRAALDELRMGECSDATLALIQATEANALRPPHGIVPSTLWPHRREVASSNNAELEKLPGDTKVFIAEDFNSFNDDNRRNRFVTCRAEQVLRLKVDAQVICLKNGVVDGISNCTKGRVTEFDANGFPKVLFENGVHAVMKPVEFEVDSAFAGDTKVVTVSRTQIPLALAWHLTIHKSQGLTIKWLVVMCTVPNDAGRQIFAHAQAYVAISRGVSRDTIRVVGFRREQVHADERALEWTKRTFGVAPPLDPGRGMCITASIMAAVLGTSQYEDWRCALEKILGLSKWKKIPAAELGKKMEYTVGCNFEELYDDVPLGPKVKHTQPLFKQHPVLRFIGASGDRELIEPETGRSVSGVEIKYRAGKRRNNPVNLQDSKGDRDYRDQCYTQMFVYGWPQNFLAVQSDVNLDYWLYKWDVNWWKKEAAPKVLAFYDRYLRWYWENDRSPDAMAPTLAFIREHDLTAMAEITGLFDKRPSASDIAAMRAWRIERDKVTCKKESTNLSPDRVAAASAAAKAAAAKEIADCAAAFAASSDAMSD